MSHAILYVINFFRSVFGCDGLTLITTRHLHGYLEDIRDARKLINELRRSYADSRDNEAEVARTACETQEKMREAYQEHLGSLKALLEQKNARLTAMEAMLDERDAKIAEIESRETGPSWVMVRDKLEKKESEIVARDAEILVLHGKIKTLERDNDIFAKSNKDWALRWEERHQALKKVLGL